MAIHSWWKLAAAIAAIGLAAATAYAAEAIANKSTAISGGVSTRRPTDYWLPGINEAGEVEFDQKKICASEGIKCK